MATLVYTAITSLDGFIEDANGSFDWSMPDAEVHAFINALERHAVTYLYGRKMYDVMTFWESADALTDESDIVKEYAEIWKSADKIVFSRTLKEPTTARTRIEREFDPSSIRKLKETLVGTVSVGGAELAAHAFSAGLVDEVHLFVSPILVGGGKPALPRGLKLPLTLLSERHFSNGVVHLHYAVRS